MISSPANTTLQLDGVTVELVDALAPTQATIAQAVASCPLPAGGSGAASESSPLAVSGTVTCSFTLKGPVVLGGALVATVSAADSGDSISSAQYSVTQFSENTAQEGCASLLAGLAASTLLPGGRLVATPDGVASTEVCEPGSKVVTFAVLPPVPSTPCGSYPVRARVAHVGVCCACCCMQPQPPGTSDHVRLPSLLHAVDSRRTAAAVSQH